MTSQTCTVLGATPPSHSHVSFKQTPPSRNFGANTKHGYGIIATMAIMSDNTGSSGNNSNNNNDHANTIRAPELSRARAREQRQQTRRILTKIKEDVRSRFKDEDLRKILSLPLEKRSSTGHVEDPDILWEYVPREQDGLMIDQFTASSILWGVTDRALRGKLKKIDGYAWTSEIKQPDGISRYIVYYYRGRGFSLPDCLKDLPYVTTCEKIWQPPSFKLEASAPIESGSKLYPWPDFSISLLGVPLTNFGTVGFVGILDRGIDSAKIHVLVTVAHILDDMEASSCGIETDTDDPTQVVQLHPINEFRRELDEAKRRPRFQKQQAYNPCLNEICLISTDGLPTDLLLNCQLQLPINCNLFFIDFLRRATTPDDNTISEQDITHYPGVLDDVEKLTKLLRSLLPLPVYKYGAKTGLTSGTLCDFRPYSECNTLIDTTTLSEADDFYCMVVEWDSPSECFADDGDSGSLVYAKHDGQMVPLGIHFGSDPSAFESYSHILWYWCDALATSLDADLLFCDFSCHS